MNFSAWSIRNPIAPILAFVILMFLGWQAFNALPITRFPTIDVPLVAVTVTQSGAAPAGILRSGSAKKASMRLTPATADWMFWISMPMLSMGPNALPT